MAHLLGLSVHSNVSRYERLVREPDIRTAFAFERILGAPASALFETIFADISRVVSDRARERLQELSQVANGVAHALRLTHLSRLAEDQPTLDI